MSENTSKEIGRLAGRFRRDRPEESGDLAKRLAVRPLARASGSWEGPGQGQELGPGSGIVADEAVERRRDGAGAMGGHAAKSHAQMLCFDDDTDALGYRPD